MMKKILVLLITGLIMSGCSCIKQSPGNVIQLSGKIEKLGMSAFQYGTHVLKSGTKTYALKSSKVNLDNYLDKQVMIKGTKIAGYPVEHGPEFIEVTEAGVQ